MPSGSERTPTSPHEATQRGHGRTVYSAASLAFMSRSRTVGPLETASTRGIELPVRSASAFHPDHEVEHPARQPAIWRPETRQLTGLRAARNCDLRRSPCRRQRAEPIEGFSRRVPRLPLKEGRHVERRRQADRQPQARRKGQRAERAVQAFARVLHARAGAPSRARDRLFDRQALVGRRSRGRQARLPEPPRKPNPREAAIIPRAG